MAEVSKYKMGAPHAEAGVAQPRRRRGLTPRARIGAPVMAVVLAAAALALQGCGSSGSTSSASGTPASSHSSGDPSTAAGAYAGVRPDPNYNGPDKSYFKTLAAPAKKAGTKFTVGYLLLDGSIPTLKAEEEAAAAKVHALGGQIVVRDAQGNAKTQISQLNQLLSQHVNAIIAYPIVPGGLAAGFRQAASEHIPVIVTQQQTSSAVPHLPNTDTDIDQSMDYSVYETMKALAHKLGKGGTFSIMSYGPPIPTLIYQTQSEEYWGKKLGLHLDGVVPAATTSSESDLEAAHTIFTKYPNVGAIVTVTDAAAVVTATVAQTEAKTNVLIASTNGGSALSVPDLESGKVTFMYRAPWEQIGRDSVVAAYDEVTKQNLPLPKLVQVAGQVASKANVSKVPFIQ